MFEWFALASAGTSLFNSYAQLRARNEARQEKVWSTQQLLKFDQQRVQEATREYGAIASYHVDKLRQDQAFTRQTLAYNILNSGMGIASTDTAGLLLRFQAYQDEMAARAKEAELIYHRPKSGLNREALQRGLAQTQAAAPFETLSTFVRGAADFGSVLKREGLL